MKRRILSVFVLFAMLVSVFVPSMADISFLKTEVSASTEPLEITFRFNGQDIGRDFNAFQASGNVQISAPGATTIRYTTSDTGATNGGANLRVGDMSNSVPIGIHSFINTRIVTRHHGGQVPTASAGTAYTAGANIALPSRQEGTREVFTISAVAIRGSDMVRATRTFILIPANSPRVQDWRKQYGELMIFSIYSDAKNLFDHNDGILFPGNDRGEWITEYQRLNQGRTYAANATRRPHDDGDRTQPDFIDYGLMEAYGPTLPANFNRRGRGSTGIAAVSGAEVAAHVEMFDHNGMRHIAQSTGMRVKGGWSRGTNLYEQRTFEFYARNGYNDFYGGGRHSSFLFPLFGEEHTLEGRGNLIHEYRRFRVRVSFVMKLPTRLPNN